MYVKGDGHNISAIASINQITVSLAGITQHSLQIGNSSSTLTQLGVAGNGVIPIGSASSDPVLNTLTAGTGISITNGPGSITIASTGVAISNYTLVNSTPYVVQSTDDFLGVNTGVAPITIQLPDSPPVGRVFMIKDIGGSANINNITLTTVGGFVNIDAAATYPMNTVYESVEVLFDGTQFWIF